MAFVPWQPQQLVAASEDGSLCKFHFGESGDGNGGAMEADEAFTNAGVAASMRATKLVQNTAAIRAIAMDREARTLIAATDAPCLLACQL